MSTPTRKLFRAAVSTTDWRGNEFVMGIMGNYHACRDGFVHVVASDMIEASALLKGVPVVSLTEVGVVYEPESKA